MFEIDSRAVYHARGCQEFPPWKKAWWIADIGLRVKRITQDPDRVYNVHLPFSGALGEGENYHQTWPYFSLIYRRETLQPFVGLSRRVTERYIFSLKMCEISFSGSNNFALFFVFNHWNIREGLFIRKSCEREVIRWHDFFQIIGSSSKLRRA